MLLARQARGNHFSTGGQGQKSPVRRKRGINFLTPISNFRGSVDPLDPDFPRPSSFLLYFAYLIATTSVVTVAYKSNEYR